MGTCLHLTSRYLREFDACRRDDERRCCGTSYAVAHCQPWLECGEAVKGRRGVGLETRSSASGVARPSPALLHCCATAHALLSFPVIPVARH